MVGSPGQSSKTWLEPGWLYDNNDDDDDDDGDDGDVDDVGDDDDDDDMVVAMTSYE